MADDRAGPRARPRSIPGSPLAPRTLSMQALARFWDSDVAYSFRQSPVAVGATVVAILMIFSAVFAAWVAPHNPFDLATLNLLDASLPPAWEEGGQPRFLLGT